MNANGRMDGLISLRHFLAVAVSASVVIGSQCNAAFFQQTGNNADFEPVRQRQLIKSQTDSQHQTRSATQPGAEEDVKRLTLTARFHLVKGTRKGVLISESSNSERKLHLCCDTARQSTAVENYCNGVVAVQDPWRVRFRPAPQNRRRGSGFPCPAGKTFSAGSVFCSDRVGGPRGPPGTDAGNCVRRASLLGKRNLHAHPQSQNLGPVCWLF